MSEEPTRRSVLHALAIPLAEAFRPRGATKTGWFTEPSPSRNISELLQAFDFTSQNGSPVNTADLLPGLISNPVALSFTYEGCSSAHPAMYETLRQLEAAMPGLKHVIFDVNPDLDSYDLILKDLRDKGGLRNPIVFLFPKNDDVAAIQEKLGLPAQSAPVAIGFSPPHGGKIDMESTAAYTPQDIVGKFMTQLSKSEGRGR